ncbi:MULTISPECIES: hypothetical protein [Thermus]|uniref:hypothetical protein n=1 Tax=Thermus TaxID=270 RepID=UPI0012EB1035|nr:MULTISPECIES: hypothetical protein [Thermus]ULR40157.1 hypothetical protein MI302_08480 [Thermus sp. NEB1569]
MRGGCWDAGQAVEEVARVLREWRRGLEAEEALEAIEEALKENNFSALLEEEA